MRLPLAFCWPAGLSAPCSLGRQVERCEGVVPLSNRTAAC
jgi:hypothetical protein